MSLLRLIPELPLLKRELIELSNRRRTYIVRFFGAIVLLTIVVLRFYETMNTLTAAQMYVPPGMRAPNRYLGSGGQVFFAVVPMLFYCVQLLMPALICGAITIEKERNTLGTLFVTRLSPMTIVLEKLASRLVPMLTFLLLSFPLLAFVYSLGGVDTVVLLSSLWLLLCECVFIASIGLLCSSWFATTASAFICSYIITLLLVIASNLLRLGASIPFLTPFSVWQLAFTPSGGGYYQSGWFVDWLQQASSGTGAAAGGSVWLRLFAIVLSSAPSMFAAAFFLLLARVFLIRRAFVSSSSALLRVFKRVDTFFTALNDRTTGGRVLINDHESLPLFDPVAWRERAKKSLGKARYLFRILVVLEGPVLFICVGTAAFSGSRDFSGLHGLLMLMWGVAAMILAMKSATMISSERTRETLEALLSTPMTAQEIVQQKIDGLRRLMIVLSIPIFSIHLTLLLMHVDPGSVLRTLNPTTLFFIAFYGVMIVMTTATVMHLIAWLSALAGLRSPTQARSVMSALTVLGVWMMVAIFVTDPRSGIYRSVSIVFGAAGDSGNYYSGFSYGQRSVPDAPAAILATVACMLRPDGSIQANESILVPISGASLRGWEIFAPFSQTQAMAFLASLAVFAVHFLLTVLTRRVTLRLAPRLLGRNENAHVPNRDDNRLTAGVTDVREMAV